MDDGTKGFVTLCSSTNAFVKSKVTLNLPYCTDKLFIMSKSDMMDHAENRVHVCFSQKRRRVRTASSQRDLSILSAVLVCLLFAIPETTAFAPQIFSVPTSRHIESSTPMYGVVSSLRKRIHAFRKPSSSPPPSSPSQIPTSFPLQVVTSETATAVAELESESGENASATREDDALSSHDAKVFALPSVDRDLNDLEQEFRDMFEHFTQYTHRDIISLRDPRMRLLFKGIAASAYEPAVYRAFEVLYEDLYPVRMAGRMIDSRMRKLMTDSQRERKEEVAIIVEATGLQEADVEDSRLGFVSTAATLNGDVFLTLAQLSETGLGVTAVDILGFESVEKLLQRLDKNDQKKLSFVDLMTGLQECAQEVCAVEECNPGAVMLQVVADLEEHPPHISEMLDDRRQKFSDRYDEMVGSFRQWEDLIPQGEGRRLDVVRGCFVGANSPQIVDALRIVYVDFKPLRLAGDIIYKLVSSFMPRIGRKQT
jgi:hypothetical protein